MSRQLYAMFLALACASAPAADYPAKPVRMIVPFAPGGSADIVGRLVGQPLAGRLGVPLVIDNRGGAGANLGGELAAAAAPDGYTVFQLNVANTIAVSMYKNLRYDPIRDFSPITQIASSPFVLVATPTLNVKGLQDFLALARSRPGQLSYGSSGNGGSSHLLMELLKARTNTDLVHIPYNSGPTLHADLVAGRIQATFATPAVMMPYIRSGKLRGLGVSTRQRSALAPELPSLAEAGVPEFDGGTWFGLVAPTRTPNAILSKLNADVVEVLRQAELKERMLAQGVEPVGSKAEEFSVFIKSEVEKWSRVVAASGAKID